MSWPMVALGDVCDTGSGGTPSRGNGAYYGGGIPWVKSGELLSDVITSTEETISEEGLKKSSAKLLDPGCILLAMYGASIGKTATLGIRAATNQAVCNIRPKDDRISTDFIRIFLEYLKPSLIRRGAGGAQPNISQNIIRDTEIPLPPLDEQRRIAGILDAADALRRRRREALALLDTLPGAIFAEMFGDRLYGPEQATDTVPLAEVAHIQSGITKGRRLKSGEKTEETAYLAVANVQDKRLDLSNVKMIEATEKERERYALAVGDLLLTEGGDPDKLGRGTVWNDEIPGAIHQNHIFRVRVTDETVQPIFLSHLLSSPYGRGYFLRMAKQTTGIASINKTQLSGFPAILPDECEQIEFVQRLKSYQDQKERNISHLGEVDGLFASLQSRAFAGEL